jgi:hypothetical protein
LTLTGISEFPVVEEYILSKNNNNNHNNKKPITETKMKIKVKFTKKKLYREIPALCGR